VSLAAPLVSIVLYDSDPLDNLTWSAIATLCELALVNPEVAARSGGIKAILKGLLKCHTLRISESIVLTLNYLLNRPDTRKYVRSHLDLESLLAPITDLHYRCLIEENQRAALP
jgi:rapamycin-insensitive companion of mTOR